MNGKAFSTLGLLVLALALAASPARAAFEIGYFNDFQKSLDAFAPGSSLKTCVTKDTLKLAYDAQDHSPSAKLIGKFNGYALLTNACGQPVWMVANLTGTGTLLRVEFDARSVNACETCIPIAYAGQSFPTVPGQFYTDYKSVGKSWVRHVIHVQIAPLIDSGEGASTVVAIGFTGLDALAGVGPRQFGIDNLSVTLDNTAPPPNQ